MSTLFHFIPRSLASLFASVGKKVVRLLSFPALLTLFASVKEPSRGPLAAFAIFCKSRLLSAIGHQSSVLCHRFSSLPSSLILALLVLVFPLSSATAAPTNDLCSGALIVPDAGPFPYLSSVTKDISDCTTNNDPPFPSCAGTVSRSIWYRFTPSTTALYAFSVGGDTSTTVIDTVMAVYLAGGAGGCGSALTEVACNDDGGDLRSGLAASLTRNRTYFIVVWLLGEDPPAPGETAVQLRVTKPATPPNDICSTAILVPSGPLPFITPTNDILLATTTGDPTAPACGSDLSSSTWFRFSPGTSGTYRISTCSEFSGSRVVDTVMAIYSAPGCAGPFTEIACNDDACATQAALSASLKAGSNYYVVVWNFGSTGPLPGSSDLATRFALIGNPLVSTRGASNVTASSADLFASLNPKEGIALVGFEWGATTNYGNWTDFQELSGTTNAILASFNLGGLLPAVTYHFRAVGSNEVGTAVGQDVTFITHGAPRLTSSVMLPDGSYQLQFTGFAQDPYTVQASSNLVDWIDLGLPDNLGSNVFRFEDLGASRAPSQFYRIRSP